MISRLILIFVIGIGAYLHMACRPSGAEQAPEGGDTMSLLVSSPSFKEGEMIPQRYTCEGDDVSPQLDWENIPAGTKSLALIFDDPDAPAGTWVHWVLFDLSPDLSGLPEGTQGTGTRGKNTSNKLEYAGPCPPRGSSHRYYFKLYALDALLGLKEGSNKADVEKAMKGHILAMGQLLGKYKR
jgi:Raf kinase inhibitor-like YbhB/YbcL family protein